MNWIKHIQYWNDLLDKNYEPFHFESYSFEKNTDVKKEIFFTFSDVATKKLIEVSKNKELQSSALLLTAIKVLLYRLTGKNTLTIDIAHPKEPKRIACVSAFSETMLFKESLFTVYNALKNTQENCEIEYSELWYFKRAGEQNLSNIFFTFNHPQQSNELDLNIHATIEVNKLITKITYNQRLFSDEFINAFFTSVNTLLESIDSIKEQNINQIPLDTRSTIKTYESNLQTIVELLNTQCKTHKDRTAITFENSEVSYTELEKYSKNIAKKLYAMDNNKRLKIALMVDRNQFLPAFIYSIFMSNNIYIPLDKELPTERINDILDIANVDLIIHDNDSLDVNENIKSCHVNELLNISSDAQHIDLPTINKNDIAYIIFTSGTTGIPKGVCVPHKSLASFSDSIFNQVIKPYKSIAAITNTVFDISLLELVCSLSKGVSVHMISKENVSNPKTLIDLLKKNTIDVLQITPSRLSVLFQYPEFNIETIGLKSILVGGEALPKDLKGKLNTSSLKTFNVYGPTETCIWSSVGDISELSEGSIGKPLDGEELLILDHSEQLLPNYISGTIWVTGNQLAENYLGDELKTNEKFKYHEHISEMRMYNTGDKGYKKSNGEIIFLGRDDNQIKIRGYRIELDEIKHVLDQHPDIYSSTIISKIDEQESHYIAAYIVENSKNQISVYREFLTSKLPSYSIPEYFISIDELPLKINGKIDIAALPDPQESNTSIEKEIKLPKTETEKKILAIFQDLFPENTKISIDDNFFHIGGNSLKATQIVLKLNEVFSVNVEIVTFFTNSSIEKLAKIVDKSSVSEQTSIPKAENKELYPVTPSQKKLWLFNELNSVSNAYNMPGIYTMKGQLERNVLEEVFRLIVERHETLRTIFIQDTETINQKVLDINDLSFTIEYHDLQGKTEDVITQHILNEVEHKFNLNEWPLFKTTLLQTHSNEYIFAFVMHHIISDAWSVNNLISEIIYGYNQRINNKEIIFKPLEIQYKDYSEWYTSYLKSDTFNANKQYWKSKLEAHIDLVEFNQNQELNSRSTSDIIKFYFDEGIYNSVTEFIKDKNITFLMFAYFTTVITLYLKYGQRSLAVGTPVTGRFHPDLEHQVGLYVNTVILRSFVEPDQTLETVLRTIRQEVLDTYRNQTYPYDLILDELSSKNGNKPLFNIMLQADHAAENEIESEILSGLEITPFFIGELEAKTDLLFNFYEMPNDKSIELILEFDTSVLSKKEVESILETVKQVIENISEETKTLSELKTNRLVETSNHLDGFLSV